MSQRDSSGYNNPNHLVEIREPSAGLVAFRTELAKPEHADIAVYAQEGKTFEEVLANVAEKLDILLDGFYDPDDLCGLLAEALRNRSMTGSHSQPHIRDNRLINVELVERDKEVELNIVEGKGPGTIVPEKNLGTQEVHTLDTQELSCKCKWPECETQIKAEFHYCNEHWSRIPVGLRNFYYKCKSPKHSHNIGEALNKITVWVVNFSGV